MQLINSQWGYVLMDTDGPGACELWREHDKGATSIGIYDDWKDAFDDIERQHARNPGNAWRIQQATPSGKPLPVYLRTDDEWTIIGVASTRIKAERVAHDNGHALVAYRADCFGPNGDESWEIIE